ncbi:MAG: AAA family ATPase [Nitrospirota bacterium]|nr:AAA family ATPase [Nitrospirota bacterium]
MSDQQSTEKQNTAREILVSWANSQENWVRSIVREVLTTHQPASDETIEEAYRTCLSEKGLSNAPVTVSPKLGLDTEDDETGEALRLTILKKVENVNRLAPGQQISFNDRLTILYGENATGKSGYVRILKRAAAVRSAEDVLPDIHATMTPGPPTAIIEYTLNGIANSVTWMGQTGLRPFTRMSIFDSRAVSFHLDDDLTYSYTPRDLALFQYVNEGIAAVSNRLDSARKKSEFDENPFLHRFQSGSVVFPKVETLSGATDVDDLETLASVSDIEVETLPRLREKVEALNPQLIASRLELVRAERELLSSIQSTATTIAEFDLHAYNQALELLKKAEEKQHKATHAALAGFDIPGMLSDAWHEFVTAGDAYLKDLGLENYPEEGKTCIYCRQDLTASAVALLRQYHDYSNSTLKADVDAARTALTAAAHTLQAVNLTILQPGVVLKMTVEEGQTPAAVYVSASKFLTSAPALLEQVAGRQAVTSPGAITDASALKDSAQAALEKVDAAIEALQTQSKERQIARAEAENNVRDLQDRIVLKAQLPAIRSAIEKAKWAERAKLIVTKRFPPLKTSLTIQTKLASEDLLNTDFQRLFEEERKALRAPAVKLQFPGKDAAAARRKSLGDRRLSEVLSEGEQKVIAISDFLAEAAIRPTSAPILFDDPVNSLDYKRIEHIVDRLYTLSADHQVVVFTHNIWFASLLLAKFEDKKSAKGCSFFSVDLGPGEQPGFISGGIHPRLDSPAKISGRINDIIQSASTETGETRKALIERGYAQLRAWCEAVSEQEILHSLSMRYRANIMVGQLKKIRADRLPGAAEVICRIFDKACGIIDAHAMATETLGTTPDLQDLTKDWEDAQEALAAYKA